MFGVDVPLWLRRRSQRPHCVRHLLSDGRGNTIAVADSDDNFSYQRFDAFGVPLENGVISVCPRSGNPTADRARRDTGELGYHGQEGYRTRHDSATAQTHFFHTDHLGTTQIMTNAAGQIVQYHSFTAFGEPADGPPFASLTQPTSPLSRYGFAGAHGYESLPPPHADNNFPYLHLGARYYDPEIGRFLQRDPIGISGGLNTFAYVNNQPTGAVDPSGHFGEWHPGAPVWANMVLFFTPRFLDDPCATRAVSNGFAAGGIVAGVLATGGLGVAALAPGSTFAGFVTMPLGAATYQVGTATGGVVTYTFHGLTRATERGAWPSTVLNAIENGVQSVGNQAGSLAYSIPGQITVFVNSYTGNVISVIPTYGGS